MRRLYLPFIFLFAGIASYAQMRKSVVYERYIDKYKDIAIEQMHKYHVPASITLAQGLFESGAGLSRLAQDANNHFGIKCHRWNGARIYHDDDERNECFRSYNHARESYEDHSLFLVQGARYKELFKLKNTDYKGWARGLKKAGYATNPRYAEKLIEIIELYNLDQYDKAKHSRREKINSHIYVSSMPAHVIYFFNDNYYVKAKQGDTFRSLSDETGISYKRLAKFNERDYNDVLSQGDIIYLKKKKTKAPKEFKGRPHIVKSGESMYLISQLYGIRLESLYKLNKLSPDYQIRVGDMLWVR